MQSLLTFKEFLLESPQRSGIPSISQLNDALVNQEEAVQIYKNNGEIISDTFQVCKTMLLNIIRETGSLITTDYFLENVPQISTESSPQLVALFSYGVKNNIIFMDSVWQYKIQLGIARRIIFGYYLIKYKGVVSGDLHSSSGEQYWKKLIMHALQEKYLVKLIENGVEHEMPENLSGIWGNTSEYRNIRIKIYAKST